MTREERENAMRCLKLWIEREPYIQTYKTCLEALEQEPCEDCISRQGVINAIANTCFFLSSKDWDELMACINSLPSVQQEPKADWIPVSEKLSEPYEQVLRTVKSFGWNCTNKTHVDIGSICPTDTDVIAWQPLPKPYKEG